MFNRQSANVKKMAYTLPTTITLGAGAYLYKKRSEYLADPVLQRGILHLKRD